jgi:glycosyltransferase involved in cell wall biosynthesis
MDVFVLPSIKEGLGLALLEAMAAARPCIASDIGGIGDIITDGVDGLLVPVANAHAIAEAAVRLFNDGALRKTLSARAEKNVAKGFSLSSMADRILGLYNEVMREKK